MKLRWPYLILGVALVLLAVRTPAAADDTGASIPAGGIAYVKSAGIVMQREDLTLSHHGVSVRYEFRNTTGHPISIPVAFPTPVIDWGKIDGEGQPQWGVGAPKFHYPAVANDFTHFMAFGATSDGRPIQARVRVMVKSQDGLDMTPWLGDRKDCPAYAATFAKEAGFD